ncbi:sigma-70 family RNA polymerase sigma factor [Actinomadura soli]|uniref:Sigma-70 family RNA polymerase sigma factor n=1 Tax=Actinomadura soli TaxID=2508997 RepID=A0A5C4JD47_9ACTN|nr:RNA polymerase subunit sigma-70 [Actinomadura soli]TMR02167.1 sigma-70 family RNA polymerase sigma factor [Actinomadura soli]
MDAAETADADVAGLLAAARSGDEVAFEALLAPHRRALHLHCYRMLGSLTDAEEAIQDTMLRAWRSLHTYQARAPLRHWLFRIATTTCLKSIERRNRTPAVLAEVGHLQPYPDRLLDDLDPVRVVEEREAVALAFVAALQLLPATQRAVVLLREVLCWSAAEVAEYLGSTVPAVNSALQRGRATLRFHHEPRERVLSAYEREILRRFIESWQRRDLDALAAVLREDAVLRMPPETVEITGRAAVVGFFATQPAGGRLEEIRLVETRANGQPALAAYLPDVTGTCLGYGIMVLTIGPAGIAEITGFPNAEIFAWFGLPRTVR